MSLITSVCLIVSDEKPRVSVCCVLVRVRLRCWLKGGFITLDGDDDRNKKRLELYITRKWTMQQHSTNMDFQCNIIVYFG